MKPVSEGGVWWREQRWEGRKGRQGKRAGGGEGGKGMEGWKGVRIRDGNNEKERERRGRNGSMLGRE